jgi:hypothetical protein
MTFGWSDVSVSEIYDESENFIEYNLVKLTPTIHSLTALCSLIDNAPGKSNATISISGTPIDVLPSLFLAAVEENVEESSNNGANR